MSGFQKATKTTAKLRLALAGPAGAGKTYSTLSIATALAEATGGRVALIDTEHGSASKYADVFDFDALELESFHPQRYIDAIHDAEASGDYTVLAIDSLSHAWMGKDGALELVDRAAKRMGTPNSFTAWRDVTPLHNQLVEAMIGCNLHLIITLRSKTEHVQEKDDRGRTVIRKVGLAPIQRDGLEYEFDVYGDLDLDNTLVVGKTRCSALAGAIIPKPGKQLAGTLVKWLGGAPAPAREVQTTESDNQRAATGSTPQRIQEVFEAWAEASAEAKRLKIDHKDLPEDASVAQIERWTIALLNRIEAAEHQPA